MARNGSGSYSVPNSFTPSTTISSSAVNANFTDIGDELTNSVAVDGQSTMIAPLKHSNGSASLPSMTFGSDPNTGVYRKGADQLGFATAGTERGYFDDDGTLVLAIGATIDGNSADSFPSGTVMLFCQTAAPTGWTKDTSNNNNAALRIVTGTVGTGGTVDFTTAFVSQTPAGTVGGHAITIAQMPLHGHPARYSNGINHDCDGHGGLGLVTDDNIEVAAYTGALGDPVGQQIGGTGGGATHTHSFTGNAINLAVKYRDAIQATKD